MIFLGRTAGAGELLVDALTEMLDREGGILQNGVLKILTAPWPASNEWVMW